MTKKFIAGGCSFTFGNELSDDVNGNTPSAKTWAHRLCENGGMEYVCTASGGLGNQAIARRVFMAINSNEDIGAVAVMWSFPSRYDWAMPEYKKLDGSRWVSISPCTIIGFSMALAVYIAAVYPAGPDPIINTFECFILC